MTWASEIAAYRNDVAASFGVFRRSPHSSLLWVTVVIDSFIVTLDDDVSVRVRDAVTAYHAERRSAYRRSGRISRNPRGQTRWSGCIEIDLIPAKLARMCSRSKSSLLAELGVDVTALRSDQYVLVVHEHALVDHRGHASADAFKRDLRAAWPGCRRVHTTELHQTGTVAENVARLAAYGSKFCFRHGVAWDGRRTQFMGDYSPEWREYVRRVYETVGIYRLLNSNVATQAGQGMAARRMYAAQAISAGGTAETEALQLCVSETSSVNEEHNATKSSHYEYDTGREFEGNGRRMRAREFIDNYDDYIDFTKIETEFYAEIKSALDRQDGGPMTPALMRAMYSPEAEREELELEQLRLCLKRTHAQINRLEAAAARDRAAASRSRPTGGDSPTGP
ncbi:hypothetical protein LPLAFNJD_LOCUS1854 [Methylorubrum aminovorans]